MNRIKLLFFINSLSGGGAEKVLINLLKALDPVKYDIALVSITGGVNEKELPEHVRYHKLLNREKSLILKRILYKMPKRLFNKLYLNGDNDIEVAFLEGFPTKVVSRGVKKAVKIAFLHMDPSKDSTFDKLYRSMSQCLEEYNRYDKVCFISEGVKQGFEKKVGKLKQGIVIHNIMDYEAINRLRKIPSDIEFTTKGIKIVVVGRLTAIKGIDRVLNAAYLLKDKYDFEIIILGDGEEWEKLNRIKNEKGLSCVKFAGYQSNPYNIISQADLLLNASYYEGYSTVASEAIYLNIPVLTTECAGMKEILADGSYGMIVDNDELSLKNGLETILGEPTIVEKYRQCIFENKNQLEEGRASKEYDAMFQELI